MVDKQLPKFGIRYFFDDGQNRDLRRRYELGPRRFPRVQSYQLDRGRLENFLFEEDQRQGCDVLDRTVTTDVVLGDPHHTVHFTQAGAPHRVTCRWVVDATGRRGFLKGKFGLRRPSPHKANATWWRVAKPLKLDDWTSDADWQGRVDTGNRWLSTNHLMGPGYWVWFIPLGSGSTSVGIVVDAEMHPYPTINRLDRLYAWLDEHEPQAAEVCRDHDDLVEDFLGLNHYPHGCARVYSNERWALTGEAGVFTDPFYSPGSDFIGVGNDLITEMILRDGDGVDIRRHAAAFNVIYLRLFEAFTKVYENQYQIFGHARVMTAKVAWDNACYWGVSALLFFQRKYRDYAFIQSIDPLLRRFFALHVTMQDYLREWHRRDTRCWSTASPASSTSRTCGGCRTSWTPARRRLAAGDARGQRRLAREVRRGVPGARVDDARRLGSADGHPAGRGAGAGAILEPVPLLEQSRSNREVTWPVRGRADEWSSWRRSWASPPCRWSRGPPLWATGCSPDGGTERSRRPVTRPRSWQSLDR